MHNAHAHFNINSNYFISVIFERFHVIVGTPKEIVAMINKRRLNMSGITLAVFEDVDVTMTTGLVKESILKEYSGRLVLSCVENTLELAKIQTTHEYDIIVHKDSMTIREAFIKCENSDKIVVVNNVYNVLKRLDVQAIVFCRVSRQILFVQ